MRKALFPILFLLISTSIEAQTIRGPFSLADHIMSASFLGKAGKTHLKPIPSEPSTFERTSAAPGYYISRDLDFANYLLNTGLATDALTLLGEKPYFPSDTLDYVTALALFDSRQFQGAADFFQKCGGAFRDPALFLGAFADIQTGNYTRAESCLESSQGEYEELSSLMKAGLGLIREDYDKYTQASAAFTYRDFRLSDSERSLDDLYKTVSRRHKSPFVAGLLSAVIPGAGKVYAGKAGEGASAFLTVVPLGIVTAEQWIKNGPSHWGTILSASLFSLFYIGNIYGSYVSVGVQQQVLADETKAIVIYNLHLPLRSFFR